MSGERKRLNVEIPQMDSFENLEANYDYLANQTLDINDENR